MCKTNRCSKQMSVSPGLEKIQPWISDICNNDVTLEQLSVITNLSLEEVKTSFNVMSFNKQACATIIAVLAKNGSSLPEFEDELLDKYTRMIYMIFQENKSLAEAQEKIGFSVEEKVTILDWESDFIRDIIKQQLCK